MVVMFSKASTGVCWYYIVQFMSISINCLSPALYGLRDNAALEHLVAPTVLRGTTEVVCSSGDILYAMFQMLHIMVAKKKKKNQTACTAKGIIRPCAS